MNKCIIALGLLLAAFALIDAQCPGRCQPNVPSKSVCLVAANGKSCRKIRGCQLREENCLRQRNQRSLLKPVDMKVCIHIRGHTGTGRCAAAPHRCELLQCSGDKQLRCYRNRNLCRRLTTCEAQRENCRRNPQNQLRHRHGQCAGTGRSANWQPCRERRSD